MLGALIAFIARKRQADREFLAKHLATRAPRAAPEELRALVNEEAQRDEEFAAKQADRVSTETAQIMALPDPAERERRMRGMLQSERRYAEQRSQAMAARAIAAADRAQLKAESPQGAFWQIGIAKDHTAGCLAMNGHFWPWTVLDRVHPPRHPGCTSFLLGYQDAVARGLMRSHDVPDEGDAVRRAANVLMEEAPDVAGELRELVDAAEQANGELRAALIAAGLTTPERFDAVTESFHPEEPRDFRGRWRKLGDVAASMATSALAWNKRRGADMSSAPSHEEVTKNWSRQLRGRLSKDAEAQRVLVAAEAANASNPLWRKIVERHEPDHTVLVTPPEEGKARALIDSTGAAHRVAGTTVVTDAAAKELAATPPKDAAKTRPAASSGYGLAAVLRHEYGHSLDEALPKDVRRKIIDAIPDPGADLSYYAGYWKGRGNDGEVIPELIAIVTQPGYTDAAWPESVQRARKLLLEALGVVEG